MGTYGIDGVIEAWRLEKLTTEQAIGQILLLLEELDQRLTEVEQRVRALPSSQKSRRATRKKSQQPRRKRKS